MAAQRLAAKLRDQRQTRTHRAKPEDALIDGTARSAQRVHDQLKLYQQLAKQNPMRAEQAWSAAKTEARTMQEILTEQLRKHPDSHETLAPLAKAARELTEQLVEQGSTDGELEQPVLRPARLEVATPAHGRVRAWGLAQHFPAGHVRVQNSTAVSVANNCTLKSEDHYHVRRVSLSVGPLLHDGTVRDALRDAIRAPGDGARIDRLWQALRRISSPTPEHGPTSHSMSVGASRSTTVTSSEVVQFGNGSYGHVTSNYVIDESVLPLSDLLAKDKALTAQFVRSFGEQPPGALRARFLRDVLRAGNATDELQLLDHATGLPDADASVLCLFGFALVDASSAVMLGTGNRLLTSTDIHRSGLSRASVVDELHKVAQTVVPTPPAAPTAQGSVSTGSRDDFSKVQLASAPPVPEITRHAARLARRLRDDVAESADTPKLDPPDPSVGLH